MYDSLLIDSSAMKYRLQNYVDCTGVTDPVGVYALDGKLNVTILVDESVWTGLYAKNGSINVVEGSGLGVYSPCGAYNVIINP